MKSTIYCLESDEIRIFREKQQARRRREILTFGILLLVLIGLIVKLYCDIESDFI